MNLAQILETVQALQSERDALWQCTDDELDMDSAEYFMRYVETAGEWDASHYRHNSKGLVYSFAARYSASRKCRISTVTRFQPGVYSGVVTNDEIFTPVDGFCGYTGRA